MNFNLQFNETNQQVSPEFKDVSYFSSGEGGNVSAAIAEHNSATNAHSDIRLLIQGLSERLSALADSDDATLDQLSEIVAYIKSNRDLISAITTDKVNVADIVDNLTTNVANKPLSAAQGVVLKALIDTITVPTALSELSDDATHRVVTDAEKAAWNAKSNFTGSYNDLTDKPTIPGAYTLPIASSSQLGGVQPVAKTDTMTQEVGVDAGGALWTAPGGGDAGSNQYKLIAYHKTTDEDVTGTLAEWTYTAYDDGSPLKIRDILVAVQNYKGAGYLFVKAYSGNSWQWVQFWPTDSKPLRAEISLMNDFTLMLKSAVVADKSIGFKAELLKLKGLIDKICVGLSGGVAASGMVICVYGR